MDLPGRSKRAVEQVARPRIALIGKVPGAIVDEQEVLRRPAGAVEAVVHKVEVGGAVAGEVVGPDRADQRVVAGEGRQARGRFVRQA